MFKESGMQSPENKTFDFAEASNDLQARFDIIESSFKNRIDQLESHAVEQFGDTLTLVSEAFTDLKKEFIFRVVRSGQWDKFPKLFEEIRVLFDTVLEVVEDGIADYMIYDRIDDEGQYGYMFRKKIKLESGEVEITKVGFNIEHSEKSEQRFSVEKKILGTEGEETQYSFRIDHEKNGNVGIDVQTPMSDSILGGVKDIRGQRTGHHFNSEKLLQFADTDAFRKLVLALKEMLEQRTVIST